jgi:uncharacterized membrane protein YhaH (DUF805 family)
MGSYATPWKKYATFSGRATRGEYWSFVLINAVIALVLYIPLFVTAGSATSSSDASNPSPLVYLPGGIFELAIIIPTLAVLVRRLHDSDRSGGWFFISFVPFIGGLWLLILTLLGGTAGANKYGADPRAAA